MVSEALQACFLISEGYMRVSVPTVDLEAKLGSLEDASRITGMGRRPTPVRSRFDDLKRDNFEASEVPVFQLGDRPLLLPPNEIPRPVPRPSRLIGRKPGAPRRGTSWQNALRSELRRPFLGAADPDIELCLLHPGEAFGLAALYARQECSCLSAAEIRVQSSEAKVLVLTPGSLLYMNEALARNLVDKAKNQADPVTPSFQRIKRERLSRSRWTVRKQEVLHQLLMKS